MAEENQKEMNEAGNFIKQEKEVEGLLQAINDKKEASKLMRLEIENLKEEFNRKEKLAKDMEAKKQAIKQEIEKSTEGKPDKRQDTAKLTDEKRNQYTTQIETNFFEFGKIKAMLEIKEKERVNELPGSEALALRAQKSGLPTAEYAKPLKPVVGIVFNMQEQESSEKKPNEDDEEKDGAAGSQIIERLYTTFRIHKDLRLTTLKSKAAEFWGLTGNQVDLLDETMKPINQNMMSKKPFANDLEQKVPTYHIVPSNTKVDKAIQNKEESQQETAVEDKTGDDFTSQFLKYFYQFRTFFVIEPKSKKPGENEEKKEMNDYHPTFNLMMLFLLLFTIFAVILFYLRNESTMRSGFVNILSKYNGTSIVDIKSMPMLLDYIEYLGAEDFKKEIEKNFKFIGQVSIRALRTRSKTCQMKGKRKGKACYEEQYTTDTKFFNPVLFKLPDGTQDYFYYYPREQLRILSEAKGLHSTYDGSGYIIAFDHTDSTYIEKHRLRFKALRPSFFQDNTKAVIVNYNLNYPVLNVNCSIEVVPGAHPALRDLSLRRSGRQSDRPAPIRARLSAEPLQPVHD